MTWDDLQARYRQTLIWRGQGLSIEEIGQRHDMSPPVARRHVSDAVRYYRAASVLPGDLPLEVLRCPASVHGALRRAGLRTVGEVATARDGMLRHIPGIGPGFFARLRADLAARYRGES